MRIALITDGIWPYVLGGMQKHSYYLCKYFAANKIEVDLIHFNRSHYDISKLEFFSEEEKKFIRSIVVDFPKEDKLPGHYIRASKKHSELITEALQDELPRYDFIYAKGFTGWDLIEKKKKGKIKCCQIGVKFHGYEMFQKMPGPKAYLNSLLLLRKPVRQITRDADVVFSYGGKVTGIIEKLGVERKKIIEVPSGVERHMLSGDVIPNKGKLKFLYLGRYERRKGIEEINKAIRNWKTEVYEFHFIGPIPENRKLKQSNVVYHGEIRDRNELLRKIRACQVLVCPSWSEGMPNVILEAMANGLAVIATDVGATSVLVNENTGWLMKSAKPELLREKLWEVIRMPREAIDQKRKRALDHISKDFVWESIGGKLVDELKKVV